MKALYRDAQLDLRTPEGIDFALPLAGPVSRLLALWIDLGVISVAGTVLMKLLAVVAAFQPDAAQGLFTVLYFLIALFYGMLTEWLWQGQTLGKRLVGIRVIDRDGLPMHVSQIIVRNLLRPVDMLPAFYLAGGIAVLSSRYGQRIGDMAANTVVVRSREIAPPDWRNLLAGKFNSMLQHSHLAARLRQRVSPELAGIALDALARRDQLDDRARLELFGELAARFRSLVEFPPEAVESLSDEQYVRNAVEILYRSR
jgi:uncharacterized RDD family membrane protein YckC